MEIKELEGYDFKYIVSKNGKIFKYKDGKINELKNYNNGIGYQMVSLKINGKYKLHYVHRLVAKSFLDNPNDLIEVNHIDFDKSNNNLSNLEWCTRKQNVSHYHSSKFKDIKYERKVKNFCVIKQLYSIDFYKYSKKWRLRIKTIQGRKHIGYFNSYQDAFNKQKSLNL
jgi:hypothetical protein